MILEILYVEPFKSSWAIQVKIFHTIEMVLHLCKTLELCWKKYVGHLQHDPDLKGNLVSGHRDNTNNLQRVNKNG
uniref:Uncharacterized protein n=1 Tax=Noccaea caerulescens TaxID=107243 RepID=A0A1J3GLP8_NOCCA